MTDQGPLQPDYRRRMEAAIAKAEDFEGRYETSHASRMHAEECWRQERARADAAEAREQALRDRVGALLVDPYYAQAVVGMTATTAETTVTDPTPIVIATDLLDALSPPTADTEESDRG